MIYLCQALPLTLCLYLSLYLPFSLFFVFAMSEGQAVQPRTFISIDDIWQDFVFGFFFQSFFAIVLLLGLGQANEAVL